MLLLLCDINLARRRRWNVIDGCFNLHILYCVAGSLDVLIHLVPLTRRTLPKRGCLDDRTLLVLAELALDKRSLLRQLLLLLQLLGDSLSFVLY